MLFFRRCVPILLLLLFALSAMGVDECRDTCRDHLGQTHCAAALCGSCGRLATAAAVVLDAPPSVAPANVLPLTADYHAVSRTNDIDHPPKSASV